MSRKHPLQLELLEDRRVPATFGVPWPNPEHLTISFVPDGTQVGSQQSQLFRLLDAAAPTAVWQAAILRALQSWAASTNLNLSLVSDSGDPLGTVGPIQSDPRFGDIRITAVPLPADVVSTAIPFDVTAGSWAGDIELNSNDLFGLNGSGDFDLLTIALHEAGHALGIDGSSNPNSPMFDTYNGPHASLTADDTLAIQTLYGSRSADAFDAASPNNRLSRATSINLSSGGNGSAATAIDANLDSAADADYFAIKPVNNQTSLSFQVQTSGISLLTPQLTVYSSSGAVLATTTASDPLHGDLSVHLANLRSGATYYVEVSAAESDAFGAGSYRLQVIPDGATPVSGTPATTMIALGDDQHTNDTLNRSTDLRQSAFQSDARYAYACQAGISDATDADFYHLRAPNGPSNTTVAMRVLAWATDVDGLDPLVRVFDAQGNAVAATVLVNENSSAVLQVDNAVPNTDYYVSVQAEHPGGLHNTGSYFLGISFSNKAMALEAFSSGTLTQDSRDDFRTVQVNQSQLFHFVLGVNSDPAPVATAVKMTIFDPAGDVVSTLTVLSGETQSMTLFLPAGTYTVRFAGATRDGSALPAINYILNGIGNSDPIGPQPTDPTLNPVDPPPNGSGTDLSYYWLQYGYYLTLAMAQSSGYPTGF